MLRLWTRGLSIVLLVGKSVLNLLADVGINATDRATIDEDLGEDVDDAVVNLARWWKEESYESHRHTSDEEDDGRELLEA